MRAETVELGLRILISAVLLIILAAYFNDEVGSLFSLTPDSTIRFASNAIFWGGMLGAGGILVVISGLLRTQNPGRNNRVLPAFAILFLLVVIFFALLYKRVVSPDTYPRLKPGETIIL